MPDTPSGHTTRVHPSAYMPLALGLLGYAPALTTTADLGPTALPPGAGPSPVFAKVAHCEEDLIVNAEACHENYPTGCTDAAKPQYDAYLNLVKNWTTFMQPAAVNVLNAPGDFENLENKTPQALTSRNHVDHAT